MASEDQEVVSFIIANVGYKGKYVKGLNEKRKEGIVQLLKEYKPSLILFQEFIWTTGLQYAPKSIRREYDYMGHQDASFGVKKSDLIVYNPMTELYNLKKEMILYGFIPTTTATLPRMHVLIISTKGAPELKFICVSWHGRWKTKGTMETKRTIKWTQLKQELLHALRLLQEYGKRKNLPIIMAGDFNLPFEFAKEVIEYALAAWEYEEPLVIYSYDPLRRKKTKLIDYYIGSKSLKLRNMKVIDWEELDCESNLVTHLDHDPVYCAITAQDVEKRNEFVRSKEKKRKKEGKIKPFKRR